MNAEANTILQLYSIDQVASLYGVSKITIYRLVETRKITFYKIKGCIRFSEQDIALYLKQNRVDSM
ncbi:hypothetical protein COT94_02120 [Candidatus Falkowbacteria bacterium CG10_big_fil_rev_8_21_14_0_10_37_14]|uniref:Helix-turn-helix domain-containing protein n=1 Tax=Candidatus Falkowbacteria bacterium CG10_big_fil_rev_8_21_14_0_10_37_14 TaxID=1974561 RepID=A0A2M6WTC2_9BACT|nr:helix-turn-helix domain-containing protein [Candidatus Falkowbacteria bacterium]PIT96040.1 MAG: hypothetical protein COT94_02120 [Candidatus Falkowbacteria bacterium CG10_big_fil_rev_8_21_14_0_10_37_14]